MPRVSIVIVSWNGLQLLKRFLPSVLETDYPDFEVVVADNASTDHTVGWLRETHPDIRIVQHPKNWFFARGNNEAIAKLESEYICLLNNDVRVTRDWLRLLVDALQIEPGVAAVQPKMLQTSNESVFEYAGACGGFIDRIGYPFGRGRIFSTLENDKGQYDDARDISWSSGACMLMRKSAFDQVGGFDERFEMHMEEIDLCWRLWRAGWRIRVEPKAQVYHLGGASLPQGSPRKTYLNFRNSLLTLYKNTSPNKWPQLMRQRRQTDRIALSKAVLTLNIAESRAIRNALRDAQRMFHLYEEVRPENDKANEMPVYNGRIAIDYYLRQISSFSNLPKDRWV